MEADLHKQLGCISATLVRIEEGLSEHKKTTRYSLDAMNKRVRMVEGKVNWGAGVVAVLGSIAAVIYGGWTR